MLIAFDVACSGAPMRKTVIVHNRYAWRCHRAGAALDGVHGLQLMTIEQLAARLAGGFMQPIDAEDFKAAVAAALASPLGELDSIKRLPGFQRAAAETLEKAWSAGLGLAEAAADARDAAAKARLEALATLEREVLAKLPRSQRRPAELAALAMDRLRHAKEIFGRIEVHGRTEMPPVCRPLLSAIAA